MKAKIITAKDIEKMSKKKKAELFKNLNLEGFLIGAEVK